MDEQTGTKRGDGKACDCCQERLEQLAAIIHKANAQILAELEASGICTELLQRFAPATNLVLGASCGAHCSDAKIGR